MLRTALGPAIANWLEDPVIVEVMLNPDGRLWVDRLKEGLADTGERLSAADGERIVRPLGWHFTVVRHRPPKFNKLPSLASVSWRFSSLHVRCQSPQSNF